MLFHNHPIRFTLLLLALSLLNGCASQQKTTPSGPLFSQSDTERKQQLQKLNNWNIKGKIAFIEHKDRSSASINWQYTGSEDTQRLDLTSYLGINVLHLRSKNKEHTIEVDGKTYQGKNLDALIYSLTGYTLPTNALTYWLKALPYNNNDDIIFDESNGLPKTLASTYQGRDWRISYSHYKNINQYQLPTKLTITQANLTIKIAINQWRL